MVDFAHSRRAFYFLAWPPDARHLERAVNIASHNFADRTFSDFYHLSSGSLQHVLKTIQLRRRDMPAIQESNHM